MQIPALLALVLLAAPACAQHAHPHGVGQLSFAGPTGQKAGRLDGKNPVFAW